MSERQVPVHLIDWTTITDAEDLVLKVARAILAQGPAFQGTTCYYRIETSETETRACAFGILVPESEYNVEMEFGSLYGILMKVKDGRLTVRDPNFLAFVLRYEEVLRLLQRAHDGAAGNTRGGSRFGPQFIERLCIFTEADPVTMPQVTESLRHMLTEFP